MMMVVLVRMRMGEDVMYHETRGGLRVYIEGTVAQ
jgi:hypothetical protein